MLLYTSIVKYMKFGEILRELIEDNDLTQKQVAKDLNIAPSTLGNYIHNNREPDFHTIKMIAGYFNVTIDYLLDYRSSKTENRSEDELLRIYRSLSNTHQNLLIEQGKLLIRFDKLR